MRIINQNDLKRYERVVENIGGSGLASELIEVLISRILLNSKTTASDSH